MTSPPPLPLQKANQRENLPSAFILFAVSGLLCSHGGFPKRTHSPISSPRGELPLPVQLRPRARCNYSHCGGDTYFFLERRGGRGREIISREENTKNKTGLLGAGGTGRLLYPPSSSVLSRPFGGLLPLCPLTTCLRVIASTVISKEITRPPSHVFFVSVLFFASYWLCFSSTGRQKIPGPAQLRASSTSFQRCPHGSD